MLAGIATLVTGVIIQLYVVGILGFIVMFAGVLVALSPPKRSEGDFVAPPRNRSGAPRRSSSFMDTLNERWDKRQGDRGQ